MGDLQDWGDAGASLGVLPRCMGYAPPCGYCLEASMTVAGSIHPMDSRLRGNDGYSPV